MAKSNIIKRRKNAVFICSTDNAINAQNKRSKALYISFFDIFLSPKYKAL